MKIDQIIFECFSAVNFLLLLIEVYFSGSVLIIYPTKVYFVFQGF